MAYLILLLFKLHSLRGRPVAGQLVLLPLPLLLLLLSLLPPLLDLLNLCLRQLSWLFYLFCCLLLFVVGCCRVLSIGWDLQRVWHTLPHAPLEDHSGKQAEPLSSLNGRTVQ